MRAAAALAAVVLVAVAQVTVAPLFPIAGAVPEFVLLGLTLIAAFGSPTAVMVLTPLAAVAAGFLSDRSPGLMLVGYLPLLPVGVGIEGAPAPLNHYLRTLGMMLATGAWLRAVLALGAVAGGAEPAMGPMLTDVILPGMFLDLVLLTVVYIPLRLAGIPGRGMTLQRSRYY